ncbi:MAG: SDR family oxidoreductase [Micropepsaceae bacterium]
MARLQKRNFANKGEAKAESQRGLQRRADAKARKSPKAKSSKKAVQAGNHDYPAPPFPEQHLTKPGLESNLDPAPMYDNPHYQGSEKLKDMVAIVTGGDSGIGRSVAVFFAREGADVAIVYLDEDSDAEDTKAAVEAEGRRCIIIAGDVADPAFCKNAVARTLEVFGKIDILVNNAAFQQHIDKIEDISDAHFDMTLKTNLYGYFYMAREVTPHLPKGGSIINTGSITGIDGSKQLLDYSMTKGGIHAFTRALSGQLAERGIRVNAVAPGPVWSPLNPAEKTPEQVSTFGETSVMKRPAQPEEIAPAYVFLAAPCCSSYITGEILPIIGGYE